MSGLTHEDPWRAVSSASPAGAITTVHVTLGGRSHLDREVLTEAFAMAASGTRAEGAILQVEVSASGGRGAAVTAIDLSE